MGIPTKSLPPRWGKVRMRVNRIRMKNFNPLTLPSPTRGEGLEEISPTKGKGFRRDFSHSGERV